MAPQEYFSKLPSELIHMIVSYLFATHEPRKGFYERNLQNLLLVNDNNHPIYRFAASCKHFRREANAWCRHFLKQHASITKYRDSHNVQRATQRNYILGRDGLLTWASKHCVFCGKKSVRSAILANGFRCCAACDKLQWPNKITKTDARKEYDLRDHHLLPELYYDRYEEGPHWPTIRYGTYMSAGVPTTMFLRADVEQLADVVHREGFASHMEARKRASEARKCRMSAKRRRANGGGAIPIIIDD